MTRHSILLVEDEPEQRETLAMLIEAEGYGVESVATAEAALERVAGESVPSLIVTDVKLPAMDGFSMFERMRSLSAIRDVPFVFITGYNDPATIKRLQTLTNVAYITKPYDIPNLLAVMKQLLSTTNERP